MTVAEVILWGRTIGAVSINEGERYADFQYAEDFIHSGIEPSPIVMPLGNRIYRFNELPVETFHGLPGLLADALPDRYGNALIDAWLASQGRTPESFNAVERLCYIGSRGMGALEFRPRTGPESLPGHALDVGELVKLASEVLTHRKNLRGFFADDPSRETALRDILQVGTSAGGARAKALVAWNEETNEVRSGQLKAGDGFTYWLLKFDGVSNNRDKELADPQGFGAIEYAYYRMARAAGISISESRFLGENGRRHFITRRFDRTADARKLHMQSLCALAHYDFNLAGGYSYEQALLTMKRLGLSMAEREELYRRMCFNLVARNQDDHVKNIAFLMDKTGQWQLAPAFDLTFSFNPNGDWTSRHQMTVNGKRDHFTREDLAACARVAGLKRGRWAEILDEVLQAVARWDAESEEAQVATAWRTHISEQLRLEALSLTGARPAPR